MKRKSCWMEYLAISTTFIFSQASRILLALKSDQASSRETILFGDRLVISFSLEEFTQCPANAINTKVAMSSGYVFTWKKSNIDFINFFNQPMTPGQTQAFALLLHSNCTR